MRFRAPIRRKANGRYQVNLGPGERQLLRTLPAQLEDLLSAPDEPNMRRLFPPAYHQPDDQDRQEEYRRLMLDDLVEGHREALATLARTADAREVSEEELAAWMRALNSLRLFLGTALDVSEDDDPRDSSSPEQQIYLVLGILQEQVVDALSRQT
jgi:hypothetical protein